MRDVTLDDTVYVHFTTRAFATGVPTTLSGTPALSVVENDNATPITSGVSVTADLASVTGLNMASAAVTAINGYEVGKSYSIYISTGTVDSVSVVGEVVGQFTVQASAAAVDLANGTDGLGMIKADTANIGTAGAGLTDLGGMSTAMKAEVNAEVDTAFSDYDPPTNTEMVARTLAAADYFDPAADTVANVTTVGTTTTNTDMLTTANILAMVYEGTEDLQDYLRLTRAALVGVLSGAATTTIVIKGEDDSKTRITATVDSSGNRSAVVTDATD